MSKTIYGPNWGLVVLVSFALLACCLGAANLDPLVGGRLLTYSIDALLVGLPTYALVWLISIRLTLATEGLTYRSMLGTKKLTWEEISSFKTRATRRRLGILTIADHVSYEITGGDLKSEEHPRNSKTIAGVTFSKSNSKSTEKETRIAFGWRVNDADKAARAIQLAALPLLIKKATDALMRNEEVSFGSVAVTNTGIRSSLMEDIFGDLFDEKNKPKEYQPWESIKSYKFEKGQFVVTCQNTKGLSVSAWTVANMPILLAMIEERSPALEKQIS